ncbi:opioid growth factor receptor-related protein, partial [Bifidobacterium animalis]
VNEKTGEVKRTNDWEERFSNLNRFLLSCLCCLLNFMLFQ